jgi:hypothetical protein
MKKKYRFIVCILREYTYFGTGFEPRNGFVIVSESRKDIPLKSGRRARRAPHCGPDRATYHEICMTKWLFTL